MFIGENVVRQIHNAVISTLLILRMHLMLLQAAALRHTDVAALRTKLPQKTIHTLINTKYQQINHISPLLSLLQKNAPQSSETFPKSALYEM